MPTIKPDGRLGGVGETSVPPVDQMAAQGGEQGVLHAVVVTLGHSVFAVVAAQLGEEGDGLVGALGDQLAEQPRHGLGEHRALAVHVGREQVGDFGVDGEPAGVEATYQLVGAEGAAQYRQRFAIVEAHAFGV